MATKQEYIEAINEKFEDRLGKASKPEKKKASVSGTGDSESEHVVRSKDK
jgi:hypothetical protein